MSKPFLEELENDLFSSNRKNPERQNPRHPFSARSQNSAKRPAFSEKKPFGQNQEKKGKWVARSGKSPISRPQKTPFAPSYILESRKAMGEWGIVVVLYIADSTSRSVLFSPRIESRGFFLPHEVREWHKFLLHLARTRYEETLRDVPDIETKDLEKIIKHDIEKAISEKYARSTVVIPLISFV